MAAAEDFKHVTLSPMRGAIAKVMTKSFNTAPHFFNSEKVDSSAFISYRNSCAPDKKPTFNDLITYVAARAIKKAPELNARWADDHIEQYDAVNIGMIVAVEGGLINQVLCDADKKGLQEISQESKILIEKARTGKQASGKITFTISNPGPGGVRAFTAIINPPQAAILAVGAAHKEVVVDESDNPVVRPIFEVCLSCDHRMVDGRSAATFLKSFKEMCENFSGA